MTGTKAQRHVGTKKMIRPKDVREWLDKRPFKPFRIRLRDGRAFKVAKSNMCIIAVRAVYIGVPDPKLPGCIKRMDYCPYDYAVSIEPVVRKKRTTSKRKDGKVKTERSS